MPIELLVFFALIGAPVLLYGLGAVNIISPRTRDIVIGTLLAAFALVFLVAWATFFLDSGVLPGNAKRGPLAVYSSEPTFKRFLYGAFWLFFTGLTFVTGCSIARSAWRRS